MRTPRLSVGLAAAALLVCFHGTDDLLASSPAQKASVPDALGRLVPPDAVALLVLSSIAEVQADLARLEELASAMKHREGDEAGPSGSPSSDLAAGDSEDKAPDLLATLSTRLGIAPERIDTTRPLGIAISLIDFGAPSPIPVFILPTADGEGLQADLNSRSGLAPVLHGDYAGVALVPGYALAPSTPAIAADLPARKIALRVHPARIMTTLQPFIEQGLQGLLDARAADSTLDAVGAQAQVAVLRWFRGALESCERLDLGVEAPEGSFEIDYSFSTRISPESFLLPAARARGLADLARCLPKSYSMVSLAGLDFDKYLDGYQSVFGELLTSTTQMPMGMDPAPYAAWTTASLDLSRLIEDHMLTAVELGENGLEWVTVYAVKDAKAFLAKAQELLEAPAALDMGIRAELQPPDRIEGVPIVTYRLQFDFTKLLEAKSGDHAEDGMTPEDARRLASYFGGDEAMICRLGAVGDKVVTVCHPEPESLAKILSALKSKKGELPPELGRAAAASQAPLCAAFWADLRPAVAALVGVFHADATDPATREACEKLRRAGPVPMSMFTYVGQDAYEGTLSVGIDAMIEMGRVLDSLPSKKDGKDEER